MRICLECHLIYVTLIMFTTRFPWASVMSVRGIDVRRRMWNSRFTVKFPPLDLGILMMRHQGRIQRLTAMYRIACSHPACSETYNVAVKSIPHVAVKYLAGREKPRVWLGSNGWRRHPRRFHISCSLTARGGSLSNHCGY